MKIKRFQSGVVTGYSFYCPGCQERHVYYTEWDPTYVGHKPAWSFNGNEQAPTFQPSLLNTGVRHKTMTDADWLEYDKLVAEKGERAPLQDPRFRHVCHLFLNDGVLDFLGDCTHHLAGQKVPLPDLPADEGG